MAGKLTLECLNRLINDLSYEDEQQFIKSIIKKEIDNRKIYYLTNVYGDRINIHANNEREAISKYISVKGLNRISLTLMIEKEGNHYILCCKICNEETISEKEFIEHLNSHDKEEIIDHLVGGYSFYHFSDRNMIY